MSIDLPEPAGEPRETPVAARVLWLVVGVIALMLAVLGIIVPIFPGLPFAIVAALCFAAVSRRLRGRLARVPRLRRPLHQWERAQDGSLGTQVTTLASLFALGMVEMMAAARRWIRDRSR